MKKFQKLVVLLLIFSMGCSTKVSRVAPDSVMDITGKWNDTDSRLVAEEMINDCLGQRWLVAFEVKNQRPVVIVGKVVNRSHEHINTQTFIKNLERTLINSGKVDFVASVDERDQIRDERDSQEGNASVQTAKVQHEETGADLMLIGSINTIVDQEGKEAVVYYQTNLELIEIQTNRKVWIGEKQVKKYVERSKTKF